jgi:predicted transcriptional regulator
MNWLGKKQTRILNLLKEGPKTLTELEEITSFDKRTIRNTIMELYDIGVVRGSTESSYRYIEPKTPIVYDTEEVTVHESQLKNLSRVI